MTAVATNPKLKNWASILDDTTRQQAELSSTMPFIQPWLALMPDAHFGRGATVGSVIPTVGAIMPAAVGVDIGCGMIAVRTQFTVGQVTTRGDLAELRRQIERAVPLSAGHYNNRVVASAEPRIARLEKLAPRDYSRTQGRTDWRLQLGTLGSGNHFIEVTVDEDAQVWLFLHSGSRGIGNRIANEHIKQANRENQAGPGGDLSWLTEGTETFEAYIADLRWAQEFALLNREEMMDRVAHQFANFMGCAVFEAEKVNCHHNFTEKLSGNDLAAWGSLLEPGAHPLGDPQTQRDPWNVWLSRKGAIAAHVGEPGLIPGSMGTASYVVVGKGNPESFCSSPHGAGRAYGRKAAERTFTMEQLETAMQGIEWSHSKAFLDEIPQAYKDIDQVMRDAADLVEVKHVLHQLVNIKGD